jgi:hypothetical protein
MLCHVPVISCLVVYQRNTFCIYSSRDVLEFHVSSQSDFVNILIQIIQELRSFLIDKRFSKNVLTVRNMNVGCAGCLVLLGDMCGSCEQF